LTQPAELEALLRENAYLKQRVAQLHGDVTDLGAENMSIRQELERVTAPRRTPAPNPLAGGQ
jgi:hypothetical protein